MAQPPTSAPVPLIIHTPCFSATDPISGQVTTDRFHFITSQQNFTNGSGLCSSLLPGIGAYPASVRTAEENSLISDIYFANFPLFPNEIESGIVRNPSLNYFMGLVDPVFKLGETSSLDRFHWIDGAPLTFGNVSGAFPWVAGEPNNFETFFEGCVEYNRDLVGWNDEECRLRRMMLCRSSCVPLAPTKSPTLLPTTSPTAFPTTPTVPTTASPITPPNTPPTTSTSSPPTSSPSILPTKSPSIFFPTKSPSTLPTKSPSILPTKAPSILPTKSPSILPTESPSILPTKSPLLQPTTSPFNMALHPTKAPTPSDSVGTSTLLVVEIIVGIVAFAIILLALYAAKKYREKRNEQKLFAFDIELSSLDEDEDLMKPMRNIKVIKKSTENDGPPLPRRDGRPPLLRRDGRLPGLTPLQTELEFHDNRVSVSQIPKVQHGVREKQFVGLAAARNMLGLPPFLRESTATVNSVAMDTSMHLHGDTNRRTVETIVTKPRSAISGLTSVNELEVASHIPTLSSDDTNAQIVTRLPKPPGMELRDSTKTTLFTDDLETEYEIENAWPNNIGSEDL